MILRLSHKLATKLKSTPTEVLPLDPNRFADWSAHCFLAKRAQFVMLTNTASLYTMVMCGPAIFSNGQLFLQARNCLREFVAADGQESIYRRFLAPATEAIRLSKPLNRSVTSSINDLVYRARVWLTEGDLSPRNASFKLNDIPLASLDYRKPREVFMSLTIRGD